MLPSSSHSYTVGWVLICSLPASNGASFLDITQDIASVNLSCSGEIEICSAVARGRDCCLVWI